MPRLLGAEPGPVAVWRHDEQIRVGRRGHHRPFGLTVNFQPFAPAPEPARGSIEQFGGRQEIERQTLDYMATRPAWQDHPRVAASRPAQGS